jgi:hypothetical protein
MIAKDDINGHNLVHAPVAGRDRIRQQTCSSRVQAFDIL